MHENAKTLDTHHKGLYIKFMSRFYFQKMGYGISQNYCNMKRGKAIITMTQKFNKHVFVGITK